MDRDKKEYEKIMKSRSDNFLAYVGKVAEEAMLEEFETREKEASDRSVPPETEAEIIAMAERFHKRTRQEKGEKSLRRFGRVAAIVVLILATAFTTAVISVDALRIRVYEFLFQEKEEYRIVTPVETSVEIAKIKGLLPEDWEGAFYPDYLPDGYQFAEAESMGDFKIIAFQNAEQEVLTFSQELWDGGEILVDNEDTEWGEVSIKGNSAFWTSKNNDTTLIWNQNQYQFMIYGPSELETLIEIAENLIFVK